MGIPGFFSFIKKYNNPNDKNSLIKNKIFNSDDDTKQNNLIYHHFFLDFNGAIYTVNNKYKPKTENSLVSHTIDYLDTLVKIYLENDELTNKNVILNTLFIAIDGVPPRSKIEQQRLRRFHSINQRNSQKKIDIRYGDGNMDGNCDGNGNINQQKLDTNMITPGTSFMKLLKDKLEEHLKNNEMYNKIKTIIFSSGDVPGEGEHKILDYIKNMKNEEIVNHNIIIYGLDADLIMLSLVSQKENIYLLREKTEYGSFSFQFDEYKFLYLDINILKLSILNEMLPLIPDINAHIHNNSSNHLLIYLINDYVFLNFLLGNDFIPKIPWFSITNNFNDTLLYTYCRLFNQHRIFLINYENNNMTINHQMLHILLETLSHIEEEECIKYYSKRQRRRINMRDVETEKERREKLLKFFPLQHLHIEREINPSFNYWRDNYYKICFNMNYNKSNMDNICFNYIESIVWTFKYYFLGEINWDWCYKYHYAPTMKDILEFLNNNIDENNINKKRKNMYYNMNLIKFKKSEPMTQQQLLLMVLPTASKHLIATKYKNLIYENINIKKYFPKSFKLSLPYHTFYWECKPILPFIDLNVIKKETKKIKLNQLEEERNKSLTNFTKTNNKFKDYIII